MPQGTVIKDGEHDVWIPLPLITDIEELEFSCPNCDASLGRNDYECPNCGTQFYESE